MANVIGLLIGLAGPLLRLFSPTRKLLHILGTLPLSDVERERIQAEVATKLIEARASVIQTGMQSKVFWVPWFMAAFPLATWFALGLLDSITNGATPDVAALPPQLKEYADAVWGSLFVSGSAVVGAGYIASAIQRRK